MTTRRPRRRVTTEPGLLFSDRSELRTFIGRTSLRAGPFCRRVHVTPPTDRLFLSYPSAKMCAVTDVKVRDETMTGREIESWVLPGLPDEMTARELVRLRIRANACGAGWEKEADAACAAFAGNRFVMIAGDRQVDDLDEVIDLTRAAEISFIRLVPLVGG
jgi:hypothetical protein